MITACITFDPNAVPAERAEELRTLFGRIYECDVTTNPQDEIAKYSIVLIVEGPGSICAISFQNNQLNISIPLNDFPSPAFYAAVDSAAWIIPDHARALLDKLVQGIGYPQQKVVFYAPYENLRDPITHLLRIVAQRLKYLGQVEWISSCDQELPNPRDVSAYVYLSYYDIQDGADQLFRVLNQRQQLSADISQKRFFEADLRMGWLFESTLQAQDGQLRLQRKEGRYLHPKLESHAFGRAALHSNATITMPMPICRALSNGFGPINEFGFRISENLAVLRERAANHKVIAVFGGSGAHGDKVFHDDTIAQQLESMLRERFSPRLHFTVLNFGMSNFTLMDEIQTFSLFVAPLRPDFVVTHTGANDCFHGMMDDPVLVGKYDLIYQNDLLTRITGATDKPRPPTAPELIVRAFRNRLRQFVEFALAGGAKMVVGLQPMWTQKPLSSREHACCQEWFRSVRPQLPPNGNVERLPHLAGKMSQATSKLRAEMSAQGKDFSLIDFGVETSKYGAEQEFFLDPFHLSAEGNRFVATKYFAAVSKAFNELPIGELSEQRIEQVI